MENMEKAKEPRNYWIDIARLIMAICVVAIHCTLSANFSSASVQPFSALNASLFRVAVPFFVLVSGYFAGSKYLSEGNRGVFLKASLKQLLLYLVWTVIYLPIIIYQQYVQASVSFGSFVLSFVQRFFFSGSIEILWYLAGCSFALFLTWVLIRMKSPLWLNLALGVLLFVIGAFGDMYFGLIPSSIASIYGGYFKVFLTTLNGVFFSFLLIQIGLALAVIHQRHPDLFSKKGLWISLAVNVVSLAILFVEAYFVATYSTPRDTNFLFSAPLVAGTLLFFLLCLPTSNRSSTVLSSLAPLSGLVYLLQVYCLALNKLLSDKVSIFANEWVKFPVVVCLCMVFGVLILLLGRVKWLRWTRKLY
jgi:surface polysaccharide O-acyltransferase-like enzyme